jgi:hypothetical protein
MFLKSIAELVELPLATIASAEKSLVVLTKLFPMIFPPNKKTPTLVKIGAEARITYPPERLGVWQETYV